MKSDLTTGTKVLIVLKDICALVTVTHILLSPWSLAYKKGPIVRVLGVLIHRNIDCHCCIMHTQAGFIFKGQIWTAPICL